MIRETGDSDLLVLLLRMGEDLDEYRYTTAVDIGALFKLNENLLRSSLVICLFIGFINDRFRLGSNIALDVHEGNTVLLFQLELICLFHDQRVPSITVGV